MEDPTLTPTPTPKSATIMLVDERPENLLSDLLVDRKGWLRIRASDGKNSSLSSSSLSSSTSPLIGDDAPVLPKVYPSCEKILRKIKFDPREEEDQDQSTLNLGVHVEENGVNVNLNVNVDDLQDFEYVPNLNDWASAAITHVLNMTKNKKTYSELIAESKVPGDMATDTKHGDEKDAKESSSSSPSARKDTDERGADPKSDPKSDSWKEVKANGNNRKEDDKEEGEGENRYDASECTQITFNTLRALLTILMPVVYHPHKDNFNLSMKNGPSIKKRGDGTSGLVSNDVEIMVNDIIPVVPVKGKRNKARARTQNYLFFPQARVYSLTTERALRQVAVGVGELLQVAKRIVIGQEQSSVHGLIPFLFQVEDGDLENGEQKQASLDVVRKKMVQSTLLTSLNPDVEAFAHLMDRVMIRPLADSRGHLKEDHQNAVYLLQRKLGQVLGGRMRGLALDIYGSCLSGLSLGNASDVDISLFIPEAWELKRQYENGKIEKQEYQKRMKKFVYRVHDAIHPARSNRKRGSYNVRKEFDHVEAVPFARVPVVKGSYLHANNPFSNDGSIHFDICILNDIAVVNSSLLKEYSMIDPRVRMLMLSVKSWIKKNNIGNAAESTLSSYTWMIMVIFYLQVIDFVPVLQCPWFMEKHGKKYDPNNRKHTINGFRTVFLESNDVLKRNVWSQPQHFKSTPVSGLLAGFFLFYARHFPMETAAVSIRLGNLSLQKSTFKSSRLWRLCVEDPFETHDSHFPHDLGTPMDERGQLKVNKALREAAKSMENMLHRCNEIYDCIGSTRYTQMSFQNHNVYKEGAHYTKRHGYEMQNWHESQNNQTDTRNHEEARNNSVKAAVAVANVTEIQATNENKPKNIAVAVANETDKQVIKDLAAANETKSQVTKGDKPHNVAENSSQKPTNRNRNRKSRNGGYKGDRAKQGGEGHFRKSGGNDETRGDQKSSSKFSKDTNGGNNQIIGKSTKLDEGGRNGGEGQKQPQRKKKNYRPKGNRMRTSNQ